MLKAVLELCCLDETVGVSRSCVCLAVFGIPNVCLDVWL